MKPESLTKYEYAQGGTIRGALNIPAQSIHPTLPTIYNICKAAGVQRVIFYCGTNSCKLARAMI